jgi:hypothetical protein
MIKFARRDRLRSAPNIARPVPEPEPELVPAVRSKLVGGVDFDVEADAVEIVAMVGPEPPDTPTALRVPSVPPTVRGPGQRRTAARPQWNLVVSPSSDLAPPPVPAPAIDLPPPREPVPEPALESAAQAPEAATPAKPEPKSESRLEPIARPNSVAPVMMDPNASLISASIVADVRGYAERPRGLMAAALMGLALIVGVTGSSFFSTRYVARVAGGTPAPELAPAEEIRLEVAPPPVARPAKTVAAPLVFQDALSIEVPSANANVGAPAHAPETAPSVIEAPAIRENVRPRHRR